MTICSKGTCFSGIKTKGRPQNTREKGSSLACGRKKVIIQWASLMAYPYGRIGRLSEGESGGGAAGEQRVLVMVLIA